MILGMAKLATGVLTRGLSGSVGYVTFVDGPFGTVLRARETPRDPETPAQLQARRRLTVAAIAWRSMTLEQSRAWRAYARQVGKGAAGRPARPQLLFTALATAYLTLHEGDDLPLLPPATGFTGDAVTVTVEAVAGAVRFLADSANHPGVTTELLLQPLASVHRNAYRAKYRSRGFFAFGPELSADVPARNGFYACAVRFFRIETGQCSPLVELGLVAVEG